MSVRVRTGRACAVALTVFAVLGGVAACGSGSDESADAAGPVTITVNGLPPATDTVNRKNYMDDVAAFTKKYPNIKLNPKEGFMDPATFAARLAGGQLEDVFYVYMTDPASLIAKHQVSEITPYLNNVVPAAKEIKPSLMKVFSDGSGKVYGLPFANYSLGLIYNRDLFTQAGLDPNAPPTSWAEVRTDAKKIAALGNGIAGYGDYSKSNTGGWHFTAELNSLGGQVATKQDSTWKASFDTDKGKQVLQQLHDMRFVDNSMGVKQKLEYADLLKQMVAGKLGMYVGSADNIPTIVNQYGGKYQNLGLGGIPDGAGTLGGGDGYMFKAGLSAAKIKAGLQWLQFRNAGADPDRIDADKAKAAAGKQPVGMPEPNIWTGAAEQKLKAANTKYANVPQQNFAPFDARTASIPLLLEPPNAQQIYAVLDTAMATVLTDPNADINALLASATTQVNSILATAK
ncbi:MAG TPA: extracellular solute-binding protein [Mycobacteriales bacterium]|jgi:multiple sugar transport system substrate-binding protein|nr:extracellular solute-binding protein [Mycobacteriales bacterium]